MAFWDRITAFFGKLKTNSENSFQGRVSEFSKHTELIDRFKVEQDRVSQIKESNKFYNEDDLAEGVVRAIASNATMGGFKLNCSDDRAKVIIDDMLRRTKLQNKAFPYLRKGMLDGDLFAQIVVAPNGDIIKIKRMPALLMRRNSNDQDEFDDPMRAFYQVDPLEGAYFALDPNRLSDRDATWFAEWQIVHARWDHDEGGRYGVPFLNSSRGSLKKIAEGALDMAVRRKTRAGMKYVHSLEDATEAELEAYKNRNKKALSNPFAAVIDFFSNKKVTISAIQGDANLSETKDIDFHVDRFFAGVPVPKALLGFEQSINRDVLEKQEVQYLRELENARSFTTGFIREIVDLQLLLKGILPEQVNYNIIWADLWGDQKMDNLSKATDIIVKLQATGLLDDEDLLRVLGAFIVDINIDEAIEKLKAKKLIESLSLDHEMQFWSMDRAGMLNAGNGSKANR